MTKTGQKIKQAIEEIAEKYKDSYTTTDEEERCIVYDEYDYDLVDIEEKKKDKDE